MKKRLLPVIHIKTPEHTLEQVDVAVANGADGVWLINHAPHGEGSATMQHLERARHRHPDLWIGVNLLGTPAHVAMRIVTMTSIRGARIDGLWADDSGIRDDGASPKARNVWTAKREAGWEGEYFGSVAFKAGPIIQDPAKAAAAAVPFMDVVTTSGTATGVAADLDKVRAMKEAVGDHRLAVASGITPENARDYMPYVDDFLVATGISQNFHTLDPAKVRVLAATLHEE
jgi:uncharacterized protein